MRKAQFIEYVGDLWPTLHVDFNEFGIFINDSNDNVLFYVSNERCGYFVGTEHLSENPLKTTLSTIVAEFAMTPITERENIKMYTVEDKSQCGNGYVNLEKSTGRLFLDDNDGTDLFTIALTKEQVIESLNKLSNVIDFGSLKITEVNTDCYSTPNSQDFNWSVPQF